MSPTNATLMRTCDRSGCGGGSGAGGAAGSLAITGSGVAAGSNAGGVAHAATCSSSKQARVRVALVTEPDSHDVNSGRAQPTSGYVEFIQIIDWSDIDPEVVAIVNPRPLDARLDTVQG